MITYTEENFFATANYSNNEEKMIGTQYYVCQ